MVKRKRVARKSTKRTGTKGKAKRKSNDLTVGFLESPMAMVLHGVPGSGKTGFAGHAPDPLFIRSKEDTGPEDLMMGRQIPKSKVETVENWKELLEICWDIALSESSKYKTIILDDVTSFEQYAQRAYCEKYYKGDWDHPKQGFNAYQQGPKATARNYIPELLQVLNKSRENGVSSILITHSVVKTFKNPEGEDYDRWQPSLDKETWEQIKRWAQYIFFINFYVPTEKQGMRNKPRDTDMAMRFLYTAWRPAFEAKSRFPLPDSIDLGDAAKEGWDNFQKELRDSFEG